MRARTRVGRTTKFFVAQIFQSAVSPNCIRQGRKLGGYRIDERLADCKSAIQQDAILRYKAKNSVLHPRAFCLRGFCCVRAFFRESLAPMKTNRLMGGILTTSLFRRRFGEDVFFLLGSLRIANDGWIEYLKGVAWSLQEAGYELRGWEGVLQGDVPLGAGLSSSAALEMATARAFAAAGGLPWDPAAMARWARRPRTSGSASTAASWTS